MQLSCVLVVALWVQVSLAQTKAADPAGSLHQALAKNAPQFRSLLDIIKFTPAAVPKAALGTLFVPNDAAVGAFLKGMGFTAKDLEARPELVDLITSYHFVPGYQVTVSDVAKAPKKAATGDDNYILDLNKNAADKLTVQDVQGNVATALSGPTAVGKVSLYVIDKVLMSGNYFNNTITALKHYPAWITTSGLVGLSGVDKALAAYKGGFTLFVPSVKAWKPIEPQMRRASNAQVADILKYHVVAGAKHVPKDFRDGEVPTLLAGHSLKFTVDATDTQLNPYKTIIELEPNVTIIPEVGRPAEVQIFNIYAGNNMIHGINRVLQPSTTAKPAAATAPAAAGGSKVTAESATKPTTTTPAAAVPVKSSTATPTKAAATASATPTATPTATPAPKPAGRHLLGFMRRLQQPVLREVVLGSAQTAVNGVAATKTREAFAAAATGTAPKQYRNRFGTLPASTAPNGCLNCWEWTKGK